MKIKKYCLSLLGFLLSFSVNAQIKWQSQFPNLPTFLNPIEMVHAGDGSNRLFVVQQRGIIYVFQNDPNVSTRKIFLDISDRVSSSGGETGLLGLAFHPNYPDSGYFFVNYTNTISGQLKSFIARYSVSFSNPDSAVKSSGKILITVDQPYSNHNGGKLAFGKNGFLYAGLGDGGSGNDPGNRAQNLSTILGKILRLDVDHSENNLNYSIPKTNPFYQNASGYREEIFAFGIRNPWKFSFDDLTGTLWLGDVGQDTREEIDTVINGGNYGWRLMEGTFCTPAVNLSCSDTAGLMRPVFDYPNLNGLADGSITGGYVYRGSEIPSLYGKYIYGDYVSGRTFILTFNGLSKATNELLSDETYSISTFGVDEKQNLYLCSYSASGKIYKLVQTSNSIHEVGSLSPDQFILFPNYPNPFNPVTEINYELKESGFVTMKIYDSLGREIETLFSKNEKSGSYKTSWNAVNNPSGVYFVKMNFNQTTQTQKIVLMK